jgi:SAM-dependent methyltransferase
VPKATYIHGTEAAEQQRLVALNALTNEEFVRFLEIPPGARVLEVGSGLGILAARVAGTAERVRVVGLELSWAQIARAVRCARVAYVQGDAHALAFRAGGFDLVYARYVLEHVHDPRVALREMHRVLHPGGRIAVLENDVSLVRFDPPCPAFERVWVAFAKLQNQLGGDGLIGRRLYRLLVSAGFRQVALSVQSEVHWHGSPRWDAWVTNIIGNVESARAALTDRRLASPAAIDEGVDELRKLANNPEGSAVFVWNRAKGLK